MHKIKPLEKLQASESHENNRTFKCKILNYNQAPFLHPQF